MLSCCVRFFVFKQKTAYEMRISDWSSDVCSSDLIYAADAAGRGAGCGREQRPPQPRLARRPARTAYRATDRSAAAAFAGQAEQEHRRSEESRVGKESVSKFTSRWLPYP